jgi:anti-sigma factor RsiW
MAIDTGSGIMNCEKLRPELMEAVLSGPEKMSSGLREHLHSCTACSEELSSFQHTMALLDEWQAPEPSPYFASRLRARVREEAPKSSFPWLGWIRRPMVATAAVALVALGAGLLETGHFNLGRVTVAGNDGVVRSTAPETAVGDLQYLDGHADLFLEFDALDGQSQTE